VTKKLTRSKRKELRAKGQLKPAEALREVETRKAAEKRAEEEAATARVHEAHEELAQRDEDDAPSSRKKRKRKGRDLTLLLIAGVTAVAGLIFWLSQRAPGKPEPSKPASSAIEAQKHAPPAAAR
jgi:hypothetical protein